MSLMHFFLDAGRLSWLALERLEAVPATTFA
jgi:hypothetical protein